MMFTKQLMNPHHSFALALASTAVVLVSVLLVDTFINTLNEDMLYCVMLYVCR